MQMTALDQWYDYVKSHNPGALRNLLHPDAVFESPVVHSPQRGHEITFKYLTAALNVLGGPGFKYVGEWRGDSGAVLEFENDIDGVKINGVDIITFSDDGKFITHFKVMIRPLKAINLVHRLIASSWESPNDGDPRRQGGGRRRPNRDLVLGGPPLSGRTKMDHGAPLSVTAV